MINAIIDLSHHNASVDFERIKQAGIIGIIHKATQGIGLIDPKYQERREIAKGLGLLWGSYHFSDDTDPLQQSEHYLSVVGHRETDELKVLDFEENGFHSMSIAHAYTFISDIELCTGRYPVFYSGNYIKQLLGGSKDVLLASCPLWISQYTGAPKIPENWNKWMLWQCTDGTAGPYASIVPGAGRCDQSMFNGNDDELRMWWTSN